MISTLEAMLIGIFGTCVHLLPLGGRVNEVLLQELFGWSLPDSLRCLLYFCLGGSILLYYFHDWVSIVFSVLRVIFTMTKPMTIDERMPYFLILTSVPIIVADQLQVFDSTLTLLSDPRWVAVICIFFTALLHIGSRMNRRNKCYLDWSLMDALFVGLAQLAALIPGAGRHYAFYTAAFLRNFQLEAAIKYSFLSYGIWLVYFGSSGASEITLTSLNMSRISLVIFLICAVSTSLLLLGGFVRQMLRIQKFTNYSIYRLIVACAVLAVYFYKH